MRFSTFSAIATFVAAALAQDLSQLPSCGTPCVSDGISGTGCSSELDVSCICKAQGWITNLSCCVSKACDASDQQKIISFAQSICSPVGVTNLPTVAGCSGSAAASATGSAAGGSVSGSVSSGIASITSAIGSAASSVSGAVETAASSAAASASATGNAAATNGDHLGLGMGIAAAAAGILAVAL